MRNTITDLFRNATKNCFTSRNSPAPSVIAKKTNKNGNRQIDSRSKASKVSKIPVGICAQFFLVSPFVFDCILFDSQYIIQFISRGFKNISRSFFIHRNQYYDISDLLMYSA